MSAYTVRKYRGKWRVRFHGIQIGPDFSDELIAHAYKHNDMQLRKCR